MYRKLFLIGLSCLMTLFVMTPIAHAQAKITGPWLWMIAPTAPGQGGANSINVDSLAVASGGAVTEADVAANGANEGDRVGNFVWTLGQISATGSDNINDCINRIGLAAGNVDDHSSYALFTLESDTVRRDAMMRVGSDDAIKVWLNGEVVHNNPVDRGASDFQDAFRVDLVAGDNLLMVKVSERGGAWSMFVGIDSGGTAGGDRGTGPTDASDPGNVGTRIVDIPDANLRAAIEAALGKASGATITVAEMATLTGLDASESNIRVLTGLEFATHLTWLWLWGNNISDISAVSGLTNLARLELSNNSISDISTVSGLTNLTVLYLSYNNISDISPLVANTGLGKGDTVDVRENPLSYLSLPIHTHIPTLQSRGVTVEFNDRTHLNVGEPYTVRLIYFLPRDRQSKPDIDTKMDTLIKNVQQAYARDMERHGFGRKTFRIETDATGKAVVHHVAGQFAAAYYEGGTIGKVLGEINEQFDIQKNIYLAVVDSGYLINGVSGKATLGSGAGGVAVINNIRNLAYYVYVASHELRHTFGLTHDFRIDSRGFTPEISKCTAEFLDVHRYFNASRQGQNFLRNTTIEMLPPSLASPPNAIRFRFEVTDADGLHQAQLLTNEVGLAGGRAGGFIACKRLNGTSSTVEFVITVLTPKNNVVYLRVIDVHGNISRSRDYPIDVTSLLPPPEVVSIPDANLATAVRETLRLSPGVALTTHTMLNLRGLYVPNRQITDLTGLEHAHHLTRLNLGGKWVSGRYVNSNEVSNFAPLLGLTQLTTLNLGGISDVSALTGLTQLMTLHLNNNAISDVSALAGLTQLTNLNLCSDR